MKAVTLPPDLEHFASEGVSAGTAFVRSLEEAEAEADREGWHSADEVMAEAEQIIAAKRSGA